MTAPAPAAASETAAKPPFRVQGIYVAEFAQRRASRARNIALLFAVGTGLVALFTATALVRGHYTDLEQVFSHLSVPIGVVIGGGMLAYRQLERSRLVQRIAVAAQADPLAVWGVKDRWLYPLSPSAPRKQLSVTLDNDVLRDIYKKPGPPKPHVQESQPVGSDEQPLPTLQADAGHSDASGHDS